MGHTGGSLSDGKSESQHWKICTRCNGKYDEEAHAYGGYSSVDDSNHKRVCSVCSYEEVSAHNKDDKRDYGNATLHDTYCSDCGKYRGAENREQHKWIGGEEDAHHCECTYEVTGSNTYHFYEVGGTAKESYSCKMVWGGIRCDHTIRISGGASIKGCSIDDYACSDATVSIGEVPLFPNGTYDFSYTGKVRRNGSSSEGITDLTPPTSWFRLNGWMQRCVASHVGTGTQTHKVAGNSISYSANGEGLSARNGSFSTDPGVNSVQDNRRSGWWSPYKGNCQGVINLGTTYDPNDGKPPFDGQKFTVTYDVGGGGWFFLGSPFFPNDDLFGDYASEGGTSIYADVYYCYRIEGTGEVPWNKTGDKFVKTYKNMYMHSSEVVYSGAHSSKEVSVSPDKNLIDRTGYRYVGYSTSVGSIGEVSPGKKHTNTGETAKVTVGSKAHMSAAIITFYLEPVKLTYGHQVRNAAEDDSEEFVELNVPRYQRTLDDFFSEDDSRKPLEFRNFYNGQKCIIPQNFEQNPDPLESLYKYAWPGFILEEARVYATENGVITETKNSGSSSGKNNNKGYLQNNSKKVIKFEEEYGMGPYGSKSIKIRRTFYDDGSVKIEVYEYNPADGYYYFKASNIPNNESNSNSSNSNKQTSSTSKDKILWEKTYDEATTTILDDSKRHIVNETVPSYYDNEQRGYASDKHFTYIYNTPTIEIEHKDYYTNEFMKGTRTEGSQKEENADISYKMQIVNQYAYVDSLVTDNVGIPHTLTIRNVNEDIETFEYQYPRHDLIAVRIFEKKANGKEEYYATIYEDDAYRDKMKKNSRYKNDIFCKLEGYGGVFAKYYSDSLNSIATQLEEELINNKKLSKKEKDKITDIFNTNKNWKIEFIYDEVDRVYIKFKDLKGNNIFIKSGDHYIGEITAKIPDEGFKYTAENLGENNRFMLVRFTQSGDGYEENPYHEKDSKNIASPYELKVNSGSGDQYIIFYYMTGNTITVEYRDENENPIKNPLIEEIDTNGSLVEIPKIDLYEIVGYKHNPDYDGTPNAQITGDKRVLTPDDKELTIPNPEETNHLVILYYKAQETLTVKYKDKEGNPIPVPPNYKTEEKCEIPEGGTAVKVPNVPGYKVVDYEYINNYTGVEPEGGTTITVVEGQNIPVPYIKGNNQLIIIYYEKKPIDTIDLTIKFVEEDPDDPNGKPNMDKPLRDPVTMPIPSDDDVPVSVPEIEEYTPVSYIEGEAPINPIPKPTKLDSGDREIIVSGDSNIEVIIIYSKKEIENLEPDKPIIITPDDNLEKVFLHANNYDSEEYTVEAAVPTSEDLYVSGDVYSYRFDTEMVEKTYPIDIRVRVHQPYYTNLDKLTTKTISTKIIDSVDLDLSYKYYDIIKAELYDLKALHLENGAIKYYNNHGRGEFSSGEANFPITDKEIPQMIYKKMENKIDIVNMEDLDTTNGTSKSDAKIQLVDGMGYDIEYNKRENVYEITIQDIDYYNSEQLAGEDSLKEQLEIEARAILEKITKIKVQELRIDMSGEESVEILTGKYYNLPEKSEALKSPDYYIPYAAGRTPLYSFLRDKDLYVMEAALNKAYKSTMEGDYRLIEAIYANNKAADESVNKAQQLNVPEINANLLNIHTPIINKVELKPSATNEASIQLENKPANITILNLEEKFDIKIANAGNHLGEKGYGNRKYNNLGLITGTEEKDPTLGLYEPHISGRKTIKQKSANELMPKDWFEKNRASESEEKAKGPSFAEYKLIKFPYDVYLTKTDANSPTGGKPQLFKANEWYNLYEYLLPSEETYTFAIPTWVKDATEYKDANGIHVLIVAENCPIDILEKALTNPLTVSDLANNAKNKNTTYILRKTFNTYISGKLYDLQIRDTDDPGYMNKIKPALKGSTADDQFASKELPIAQPGQVPAYNMGLKLGYRFYFDLKTKGVSNKEITIKPNIYYVSKDGTTIKNLKNDEISLFYHTKGTLYNKLTAKDLNVKMTMAATHGIVNNPAFTQETIAASQVSNRDFRSQIVIGKIVDGLTLLREKVKLPYDDIVQIGRACGFTGTDAEVRTALIDSALNNAKTANKTITNENMIKDATGHWYGEYYLPASTYVYLGNVEREAVIKGSAKSAELRDGYLVVVFEEITTEDDVDDEAISQKYLTYDAPTINSQWKKEGLETAIQIPNGKPRPNNQVEICIPGGNSLSEAGVMAIYQVGLRANNDFEVEGTH